MTNMNITGLMKIFMILDVSVFYMLIIRIDYMFYCFSMI